MYNQLFKWVACLCLVMGMAYTTYAQKSDIASLKEEAENHKNDTNGVEPLRKLSLTLQASQPDSALIYAHKGLTLARKLSFKKGEANCINRIGVLFWKNGKYAQALSLLLESLKLREEIDDRLGMLKSMSDIGIVYSDQLDNTKALTYHFKAKTMADELRDKPRLGIIYANIGNCYLKLGKVDSALTYEMKAYTIKQSLKDTASLQNVISVLGDIYYKKGYNTLALEHYRQSIVYARKNDDPNMIVDNYNSIAQLYHKTGPADSSIHYAEQAINVAQSAKYPEGIYNGANLLTNAYHTLNEHLELKYFKMAVAAKDSMFNAEKIKQIQTLSFNEAARQEEIAEEKHHEAEQRIINLQLAGIAVFIPGFFLLVLLLSKSRTHRKVIDFLSVLSLLLAFEFISLFIHPFVMRISNHLPVLELLLLVIIASVLVPMHHNVTHWVRARLVHGHHHPEPPVQPQPKKEEEKPLTEEE